jgi:hypothetical protein
VIFLPVSFDNFSQIKKKTPHFVVGKLHPSFENRNRSTSRKNYSKFACGSHLTLSNHRPAFWQRTF